MLVFPPFRLDDEQERLWKGESLLTLRRKPFAILRHLAAHPGKLVTHEELLRAVWHGAVISDSAMRSHLHELRQVLGEGVVETVIGRGYRFVAKIGEEERSAPPPVVPRLDPLVVGRDAEIELLRAAFERACAGQRQLCFVTGQPGIGKTTLVRAFLAGLGPRPVAVASGACFEQHGTPEPYLAVIDALTGLARSARGAQVVEALVRHAPTFVAQVPHLVGDDQLAEARRRAAGGSEARQLRELCEAMEAMSSRDPLVLVLEDLQWSDIATIDLLSVLGQRRELARLLVIGTSRQAESQSPAHPLSSVLRSLTVRSGALAVQVPQIGVAAVQTFLDRRFSGHELPQQLTDLVARITGGTPLFMVSLLDELADRGVLAEQDGRWTLTVSIDDVHAHRPASVKQLIDMQLDRLSACEQRVLEAAAIVGAEFSTHLVAAALELPVEEVDDTCDSLLRRSLFLRAEPDGRYGVTHALVQEVCVERTGSARRQRWHRLVAEALQRDPLAGEVSHLLAKHFEAAGDPARAVPAYAAAGRQAGLRFATSDAIALCARALDLLPRLPASRERDRLELEILGTMCGQLSSTSFKTTFAGREPVAVYTRAIEIARSLDDPSSVYAAITELCNYNMMVAEYRQSSKPFVELETIEQAHELDPALLHAGIFARAYTAFFTGDLGTALRLLERLAPPEHEPSVFHANLPGRTIALGHLAFVRWVVGDSDRALEESVATLDLAARTGVPVLPALGHVVRARLRYLRRDPLPIAEEEALEAVRAAAPDLGLLTEAKAFALWARARRTPLSLDEIRPALDALDQRLTEVSTCSTLLAQVLIDVLRTSGHAAEARRLTDDILSFAVSRDEVVFLPELLRIRGEQLEPTDPAAAARDYREAVDLARSTGAKSLERRAMGSLAALEASTTAGGQRPGPGALADEGSWREKNGRRGVSRVSRHSAGRAGRRRVGPGLLLRLLLRCLLLRRWRLGDRPGCGAGAQARRTEVMDLAVPADPEQLVVVRPKGEQLADAERLCERDLLDALESPVEDVDALSAQARTEDDGAYPIADHRHAAVHERPAVPDGAANRRQLAREVIAALGSYARRQRAVGQEADAEGDVSARHRDRGLAAHGLQVPQPEVRPIRDPCPLAIAGVAERGLNDRARAVHRSLVLEASTKRARIDIEHGEPCASRRIVLEDEGSSDEGRLEQARPLPGHRDLAAAFVLHDGALRAEREHVTRAREGDPAQEARLLSSRAHIEAPPVAADGVSRGDDTHRVAVCFGQLPVRGE